jgi:PAS domain S-box-containing protein
MTIIQAFINFVAWLGKICHWTWLGLTLLFGAFSALAQTPALHIGTQDSYLLSPAFSFLDDASTALTLEDVLRPDAQTRFKPVSGGAQSTNFGATNSAIWLRVQLQTDADTPSRWLIELANPAMDRIDLYVSNAQGTYAHQTGGDSLPFADRVVPHRNHVMPIEIESSGQATVYLRVASQGTVSAPVTLWQPDALWQSDQRSYSIFSLYFGLLIGLVVYNLLLFVSVRDPAYLIYVVFAGFVGLSQVASSGIGGQLLWPDALWWNNRSLFIAYAVGGVFGVSFVRFFLNTKSKLSRIDWCLRGVLVLYLMSATAAFLMPYGFAARLVTWTTVLSIVVVVAATVGSLRDRHPGAQYFALAWFFFLSGMGVLALHNFGHLPSNQFTANAVLIGSAFEMVLLSLALADRINLARQEKELALAQVGTEQAQVQALRQSQERYVAVIEHVGEGMLVLQNDRIVFANTRATEILEMRKDEIFADGFLSRIHADDRDRLVQQIQLRISSGGASMRSEVRFAQIGKPVKWLEFGDSAVPWDGGQGLLIFFLDVTERHAAEQEIRTTLHRQQELNDLRSRFVAMTSHEFRTPLTSILSAQDLLKNFESRMAPDQKGELLDMIEAGVHRMTAMLERVLLLGQADAAMLEFKPQILDLQALCEDIVADVKAQADHLHCPVVSTYLSGMAPGLYDKNLLHHVLSNLLSNAIKYSPAGGQVNLTVRTEQGWAVLDVADEGIGIPAAELGDLFVSFQRASNVGEIRGTGLGLAIVKQALDLHGGTVEVRSTVGLGTTFTVRLPR